MIDESRLYRAEGTGHAAAWQKLAAGCPSSFTPPSFEVFEHGRQRASGLTTKAPLEYATEIVSKW